MINKHTEIPKREDYQHPGDFHQALQHHLTFTLEHTITDVIAAVSGLQSIGSSLANTVNEYGKKFYSDDELEGLGNAISALSQSVILKMVDIDGVVNAASSALDTTREGIDHE